MARQEGSALVSSPGKYEASDWIWIPLARGGMVTIGWPILLQSHPVITPGGDSNICRDDLSQDEGR